MKTSSLPLHSFSRSRVVVMARGAAASDVVLTGRCTRHRRWMKQRRCLLYSRNDAAHCPPTRFTGWPEATLHREAPTSANVGANYFLAFSEVRQARLDGPCRGHSCRKTPSAGGSFVFLTSRPATLTLSMSDDRPVYQRVRRSSVHQQWSIGHRGKCCRVASRSDKRDLRDQHTMNAFGNGTRCVIVRADTACHVAWTMPGATINPATSSSQRLPANKPKLFGVAPGMKLSVHS
jgi:hypothetical protein